MPKPVLSDSLFNASDVASAILNEADLSSIGNTFAVVDRTSLFTAQNSYILSSNGAGAYSFNGFMFVNFRIERSGGAVSGTCVSISDSNFYPTKLHTMPTISHEGDRANYVAFNTSGDIDMHLPSDQGSSAFFSVINGWYRFA